MYFTPKITRSGNVTCCFSHNTWI